MSTYSQYSSFAPLALAKPLMPKGVEHKIIAKDNFDRETIAKPLMPKGVEHRVHLAEFLTLEVAKPLMPKGVEHVTASLIDLILENC